MATRELSYDIPGYEYIGDINLTYGGRWYGVQSEETDENGIVTRSRYDCNTGHVIDVINLDNGTLVVAHGYIYTARRISEWRSALECCGLRISEYRDRPREERRAILLDSMCLYAGYDESESAADCRMFDLNTRNLEALVLEQVNNWAQ